MKNFIQFINHASILISNENKSILTDPWYYGTSFDDGWKLLYENEKNDIISLLNRVNYIWISHEHPDHFSVRFLIDFEEYIKKNNIIFLFQKTKDQRVVKFLKNKKFSYIELNDNTSFNIDKNFEIKIQKSDFYDSALIININNIKIFNLNDCPIRSTKDLKRFKKIYGTCDFLLTQFSYAAWKGGKNNIRWRKQAASEKIDCLINQSNILEAKYTIPFASFIYFCDIYNFYLNDSVNTPNKILNIKNKLNSKLLFLKPYQNLNLNNVSNNDEGYDYWNSVFNNKDFLKIEKNQKIYKFEILEKEFYNYIEKIYKNNSRIIIKLLSKIPFLEIFKPIKIYLKDLDITLEVDIEKKIIKNIKDTPDIEMFSRSLYLIFKENFGFDTLTVNGCFEEKKKNSFIKMSKSFSIGNLNNLGIKLNFYSILNINLAILFFKKIKFVKDRIE